MTTTPTQVQAASAVILTNHTGQHRCDDGVYYGVSAWQYCPTQAAHRTLTDTIDQLRSAPHAAAHSPAAVDAVAAGMTGFVLAELAEEDREGWRATARYAIEALAAHLDGIEP